MTQPLSRAARALRWAGVKQRTVVPRFRISRAELDVLGAAGFGDPFGGFR
jgi:predicted deacetylase